LGQILGWVGATPSPPMAAAAVLEEDEELEQGDEDHARKAHRRVIDNEVKDVVVGNEDATVGETIGGASAARRGDAAAAIHT